MHTHILAEPILLSLQLIGARLGKAVLELPVRPVLLPLRLVGRQAGGAGRVGSGFGVAGGEGVLGSGEGAEREGVGGGAA